ncbi:MAG: 2Fe-2S iron-sulfur cluster binding domain-containing protein [Flavobacterium sp.]|nr:2Fe-2S iron-sulfur cluster binding domain-containing protein [Flavobacterium sp.]
MAKFYSIPVAEVHKETPDCVAVTMAIPHELQEQFQYKAGQYLTFRAQINGAEVRRSYSLATAPHEQKWQVAIKKIHNGVFSSFANDQLKPGMMLEVMQPQGTFFAEPSAHTQHYIAFAAGSGITPILSLIKMHLAAEPESTFTLFYQNRSVKSIVYKEELEQLKNTHFNRFELFHFLTQEHRSAELFNGRFSAEKLAVIAQKLLDISSIAACYLCGPEEMIHLVREQLEAAGLPKQRIHYELFTSGLTAADKERISKIVEKKVDGTEVTILDGGKEFHFVMGKDFDNLLDGAIAAGADLPYACKGGVCSTCRCQVIEGSVEMKLNYSIEAEDLAKNYVLSCQAVPTSQKVVVDFGI